MDNNEKIQEAVAAFIIFQRPTMLNVLSPLLLQKEELLQTESPDFHQEITNQFETLIRREIAEYIAQHMNFNPEEVFLVVENLDVPGFIGDFVAEPEELDEEDDLGPEV